MLALPTGNAAELPTNTVSLDEGTCGRNLQGGADKTASTTARPTFFLYGDGGLSSYVAAIDGKRIGTFRSANTAVVCIVAPGRLKDGGHVLKGTELAPHRGLTVRLRFVVDTVPPSPPSRPSLAADTDSDVQGDGITTVQAITFSGTAAPGQFIQLRLDGVAGVGGALVDASGRWSATTVPLTPGTHSLTAVAIDRAGNRSTPSAAAAVTIAPPVA